MVMLLFYVVSRLKYDVFGRSVQLKDIQGIESVFGRGFLDTKCYFDLDSLGEAISELCLFGDRNIRVYFNDVNDIGIVGGREDLNPDRKWWTAFRRFAEKVDGFPAGCKVKYWYSPDRKAFWSSKFNIGSPPYQAHVELFGDAVQAFSCFVHEEPNEVSFSSRRSNVENLKPGEGVVCDNNSLWVGSSKVLLSSATRLHRAFDNMGRMGYEVRDGGYNGWHRGGDVRIVFPGRGAVVSSFRNGGGTSYYVTENSLRENVAKYLKSDRNVKRMWA